MGEHRKDMPARDRDRPLRHVEWRRYTARRHDADPYGPRPSNPERDSHISDSRGSSVRAAEFQPNASIYRGPSSPPSATEAAPSGSGVNRTFRPTINSPAPNSHQAPSYFSNSTLPQANLSPQSGPGTSFLSDVYLGAAIHSSHQEQVTPGALADRAALSLPTSPPPTENHVTVPNIFSGQQSRSSRYLEHREGTNPIKRFLYHTHSNGRNDNTLVTIGYDGRTTQLDGRITELHIKLTCLHPFKHSSGAWWGFQHPPAVGRRAERTSMAELQRCEDEEGAAESMLPPPNVFQEMLAVCWQTAEGECMFGVTEEGLPDWPNGLKAKDTETRTMQLLEGWLNCDYDESASNGEVETRLSPRLRRTKCANSLDHLDASELHTTRAIFAGPCVVFSNLQADQMIAKEVADLYIPSFRVGAVTLPKPSVGTGSGRRSVHAW